MKTLKVCRQCLLTGTITEILLCAFAVGVNYRQKQKVQQDLAELVLLMRELDVERCEFMLYTGVLGRRCRFGSRPPRYLDVVTASYMSVLESNVYKYVCTIPHLSRVQQHYV